MNLLIAESVALLAATFLVFALIGATLAGPKKRKNRGPSAFDMPDPAQGPTYSRPEPVRYLDAAAEHFTAGVTAPVAVPTPQAAAKTVDLDRPAYIPFAPTQFETIAVPATVAPATTVDVIAAAAPRPAHVEPRISSLAVMTPESVEAAVQQAGSGLEPLRLQVPQGAPDDLTVISGITDDQQKQLNDYGVYHFWQIAGWSPENVAWVSSRVLSPHRIARENWMAQAAKLSGLKS
ncbi:MAG: hypothetical protein WDN06_18885 [Asticcacaulis sp.]